MSILELAAEEAGRHGDARVTRIHVKLGPLSGVVQESLLYAYEFARLGSTLEQAELIIQEAPVLVRCPACETARPAVSAFDIRCAECGTPASELLGGRELELVSMEIQ
jgi:hydrogenase nickel incorporation protein HypA/HybF